ncbi:hypothetical protein STEG23_033195, partial [Scotinomys teguina]
HMLESKSQCDSLKRRQMGTNMKMEQFSVFTQQDSNERDASLRRKRLTCNETRKLQNHAQYKVKDEGVKDEASRHGGPTPGSPTPGSPTPGSPTPGSPTPGSPTPGKLK